MQQSVADNWHDFEIHTMFGFVNPTPLLRAFNGRVSAICRTQQAVGPMTRRIQRPATTTMVPVRMQATTTELEADVRTELYKLFAEKECMPICVRLAWHDAGTFNAADGSGGANASIRFKPEAEHDANNGLDIARKLLQPIKDAYPDISYADLYQLASVAAIEYSGGPKIPFRMGRVDASESDCTPDGRLPDGDKRMPHLRGVFQRMGFNDKEITVLSGAHTLGRAHQERSGFDGPWTKTPIKFDNSYFIEILKDDPDPDLLRLSSDLALLDEPETKALCEKYATDQEAFFMDYVDAHKKLSELGCF